MSSIFASRSVTILPSYRLWCERTPLVRTNLQAHVREADEQNPVLVDRKSRIEPADALDERAANDAIGDHEREPEDHVLEKGLGGRVVESQAEPIAIDLDSRGVGEPDVGLAVEEANEPIEEFRVVVVVVVEKGEVRGSRERDTGIPGRGDSRMRLGDVPQSSIVECREGGYGLVGRPVDDYDELEVRERLGEHALDAPYDVLCPVVRRDDDAYARHDVRCEVRG